MESEVVIKEHLNNALNTFSQGEYLDDMLEAKKVYFEVTGIANEEDDDYESRMNSFNDWYVLQFQSSRSARTVIKEYIVQNQVEDEVKDSLLNFSFSYYEFVGRSFRKHIVLKDILHDKKILLPKDHYELGMVKNDTFVGRLITHQDQSFLLDGVCVMPKEVSYLLKKEAKKVRKMDKEEEEIHFLMQLENLKTKWQRFLHIDPLKIFVFD